MNYFYLLLFLIDCVFSHLKIINTDLNKTVEIFQDQDAAFGNRFGDYEKAYLFEASPLLACGPKIQSPFEYLNSSEIKLVALIKRGECTFDQKVFVAQQSGYTGVLIFNNDTDRIFPMNSDNPRSDDMIPSRMVSLMDGIRLRRMYTYTKDRQNYMVVFIDNYNFNIQYYIIAFLGFISLGFFIIGIGLGIKYCRDAYKRRANRLRQCHLKKIPLKKFIKGHDPYETCAICLDDFKDGDKLRILPCNHAYHSSCIDPWLLKQKRNCPICKYRIKIPGRNDDSDDGAEQPQTQTTPSNEQTPLIDSQNLTATNYSSNNELDVQFAPDQATSTSNGYENLSFEKGENNSEIRDNNDVSNNKEHQQSTDLTKIV